MHLKYFFITFVFSFFNSYANSDSLEKAISDFEAALRLNPGHLNARRYKAETLVAIGRKCEDKKKYEEALKNYENCLSIFPDHKEAKISIEHLKKKKNLPTSTMINTIEPLPNFDAAAVTVGTGVDTVSEIIDLDAKKDKKKHKNERKSRSKNRHWSSSSGSSSDESSSSIDSSDSSGSSSSSDDSSRSNSYSPGRVNRRVKYKKEHRDSLSPLSKRMAQYNNPPAQTIDQPNSLSIKSQQHQSPYYHQQQLNTLQLPPQQLHSSNMSDKDDYGVKMRKILEQIKDYDSDYDKVNFLILSLILYAFLLNLTRV